MQYLTDDQIDFMGAVGDRSRFELLAKQIAIPRVAGTEGSEKVKTIIKIHFADLGWSVESNTFRGAPPHPHEARTFENIIASFNKHSPRKLILACHHDSKWDANGEFIGATDSALPCAMLMEMASSLTDYLKNSPSDDVSLQMIFFDGEEAFVDWTETDSLYGARHLAEKWEKESHISGAQNRNVLHGIDLLVLLDILGHKDVEILPIFTETHPYFRRLTEIEHDLLRFGHIRKRKGRKYFQERRPLGFNAIDDDHRPFLDRGVPVVHICPVRFPPFWHTKRDNLKIVDFEASEEIVKVLRIFVCEYLSCVIDEAKLEL